MFEAYNKSVPLSCLCVCVSLSVCVYILYIANAIGKYARIYARISIQVTMQSIR